MHFKTPDKGGALRSYYIFEGLVKRGFEVEVITAQNAKNYEVKVVQNTQIHYLPVNYSNSQGPLSRIRAFLRFNKLAGRLLKDLKKPDFLYCISTPLTAGLVGIKYKESTGVPYIFEVGDLWPEAPIQMGVIRNGWLKKRLFKMESQIYQDAHSVVTLSPEIEESIKSRFPEVKTLPLPNMSDNQYFGSLSQTDELMPEFKFVIGYIGAIGKANHLDYLVELATTCQETDLDIGFLIMGEGSELDRISSDVEDLKNIKILPFSNKKIVREVYQSINMAYISFKNIQVLQTGSPNKFFDALAAGKPIILNFEGYLADLVRENNCGFTYDPETPADFTDKIQVYIEKGEFYEAASMASKKLAIKFDKELLLDQFSEELTASQVLL